VCDRVRGREGGREGTTLRPPRLTTHSTSHVLWSSVASPTSESVSIQRLNLAQDNKALHKYIM